MRVLLGIVLGRHAHRGRRLCLRLPQCEVAQPPLVNWDVVGQKWDHLAERARAEWNQLAAR
jgi:hypothetical protein